MINRRDCLKSGVAGLGAALLTSVSDAVLDTSLLEEYVFHHDHIIGTSLDLIVSVPNEASAIAAEAAVLNEVERLRRVLSKYDPASELSWVNRTFGPVPVSPDLAAVLQAYELWNRTTAGAFNGRVGALTQEWERAATINELPETDMLHRFALGLRSPGWRLEAGNILTRINDAILDTNALGKAYIIDKAVQAARSAAPEVTGLLLNVGGDVRAWGTSPGREGWAVGIQSPLCHYDNARPLAGLRLENQAVAGSGGYQRFYTIAGRRYSHVIDPRTGWPAEGAAGATVVAGDSVTANALATSLCVLSPDEGLRLVSGIAGAECLIVADDGKLFRSPGLKLLEVSRAFFDIYQEKKDEKPIEPWPEGYQLTLALELPKLDAKRYRKPYVAVWIEDDKGKALRTLAVWGNAPKYLKDLTDWWKIGNGDRDLVKAVTRATRGPGKYELTWDGKDDKGNAISQGNYTVRVEVHREFGSHLRQSGKIECRDKAATAKLEKNAETNETVVEFKKPEKK